MESNPQSSDELAEAKKIEDLEEAEREALANKEI